MQQAICMVYYGLWREARKVFWNDIKGVIVGSHSVGLFCSSIELLSLSSIKATI
jgi:hypothetical protein